jgi:hypothetical protein
MVVGKKPTGIQKKALCILVLKRRRPEVEMKTMYVSRWNILYIFHISSSKRAH